MKNIRRVGKENRRNMFWVPFLGGVMGGFYTPGKTYIF